MSDASPDRAHHRSATLRQKHQGLRTYNPVLLTLLMLVALVFSPWVRLVICAWRGFWEGIDDSRSAVVIWARFLKDWCGGLR